MIGFLIFLVILVGLILTGALIYFKRYVLGSISAGITVVIFIALVMLKPWAFVDSYELGYRFNKLTGEITVLNRTGLVEKTPLIEDINTVDLRPRQVCINVGMGGASRTESDSPNRRVLNCKLVQFNPAGLKTFLAWHGRADYSGDGFDDLLKIYAYDGTNRNYPFLTILKELKGEDTATVLPAPVPVQ